MLEDKQEVTGVTLHHMNEHFDEGEIIAQKEYSIQGEREKPLKIVLSRIMISMLRDYLREDL